MQNGRSSDRFHFTELQLFRQNDEAKCYETLWKDRQDKQDIKHRGNKRRSRRWKTIHYSRSMKIKQNKNTPKRKAHRL